ncbi:MAG: helix-turn-helix domain-containing protein [Deltaproteobacteria bacterium]|nr:helix-turn-helix domain-containing protein [Deltaproteobacteria bacterium]
MSSSFMTISEACASLKVCRNTLRTMIRDGRIKAINLRPGARRPTWRIFAESLTNPDSSEEAILLLDIRKRAGL